MVFLGHLWYLSDFPLLNQMIYSFHVVAFFILSGYVIKKKQSETNFFKFVWKKFKRLIIPAIVSVLITLPLYFYKNPSVSAVDALKRIFFYEGLVAYNDPVWFLIILFEAAVVERLLKIKDKNTYIKILYFFFFIVSGFLIYNFNVFLPFGFRKLLICLAFIVLGMLLREFINVLKQNTKTMNIFLAITFVVSLALWVLFAIFLNPKVSIYYFNLGNYWYFCLSGIFGSAWFFILCFGIAKLTKRFEKVGQETIWILGTHYLFTRWFRSLATDLKFAYTPIYSFSAIIFTFVIILLYLLVISSMKKIANNYKNKKN